MTGLIALLALSLSSVPITLADSVSSATAASAPSVVSLPGPKPSERCPNGAPSIPPAGSFCATVLTAADKPAPTASCSFDSASCIAPACLAISTLTVPCIQPSNPCCGATSTSTSYAPCPTACPSFCAGTSYVMVTTGCPGSSGDGSEPTPTPPNSPGGPNPTQPGGPSPTHGGPGGTETLLPHPTGPFGSVPPGTGSPSGGSPSGRTSGSPQTSARPSTSSPPTATANGAGRLAIGWF